MTERRTRNEPLDRTVEDGVRQTDGNVGVYDDDRVDPAATTVTSPRDPVAADPNVRTTPLNEPRTAPRPGPTTYQTTETRRAGGMPLVTWVTIAIVAIIVLWLLFAFVF